MIFEVSIRSELPFLDTLEADQVRHPVSIGFSLRSCTKSAWDGCSLSCVDNVCRAGVCRLIMEILVFRNLNHQAGKYARMKQDK